MNPEQAALLLAVDPLGLGGARLRGAPGPAREAWLSTLRALLPDHAPWRRLPLHADDHRLYGGLDLAATLQHGRPVLQPGLLAQADGGCLLVPSAERLAPGRVAALASVLDRHIVPLARDGLVADLPARLALIAFDEAAADDPPLADALVDRLAFSLTLDDAEQGAGDDLPTLAARVVAARRRLPAVGHDEALPEALVAAADALGIVSLRAASLALRAARALAALAGRDRVTADDAAAAAALVLAPRATRLPAAADEDGVVDDAGDDVDQTPPPAVSPPAEAEVASDPSPAPPLDDGSPPVERLLEAALAALPPGLLALLAAGDTTRRAGGAGRAGAQHDGAGRGRPCGARRGDPRGGARLHLVATLRAAAPWQPLRRREAEARSVPAGSAALPRVHIRRDDFHTVRRRPRRQTTTVFVVDASGSAALHRLAEAKGAVELLLAECYVRRDRVALVSFRGRPEGPGAEVLLPPTRSLARARRCLAGLAGGGGTPLAAGLDLARQVVDEEMRRGATPVVVVLSDGRANLSRDGSPGREAAGADALAAARPWREAGAGVLWLDTAPQPQPAAQRVAQAMGARYLPLPHADARQVSQVVQATAAR
ncbi:magnesium chelatase subunit D [Rubrivivax albus]|uniref:Magnesium chelatase subunit D n=1 Tax=Rubrivivax albus TaxID=2499835 RepID=A0A437JU26_9BURK|nr:magnesium chelatase subunit D [Rubrivivax albus]RVT50774.1 magnesium chelatase subunit D [Rubrivivax albus]